jgi:polyhydroxybutyrate depolymerase
MEVAGKPSPGCDAASAPTGVTEVSWPVGEETYIYRVHVPSGYDQDRPMPVVMGFHGAAQDAQLFERISRLPAHGEENDYIAVVPHATTNALFAATADPAVDSVARMLDEIEARWCVDEDRVFATGISQGGFFLGGLACNLSDRFAALAPVAGWIVLDDCPPTRPVPTVEFHGTADPLIGYEIIPPTAAAVAAANGCSPTPTEEATGADVTRIWFDCPDGNDVEVYRVTDGGHQWPGDANPRFPELLGTATMTIDATDLAWKFFQEHPMPSSGS